MTTELPTSSYKRVMTVVVCAPLAIMCFACSYMESQVDGQLVGAEDERPSVAGHHQGEAPLTFAASVVGHFANGGSWHFSMNSAGSAEVCVTGRHQRERMTVQVSLEDRAKLLESLESAGFFESEPQLGSGAPDSIIIVVTAASALRGNSVTVYGMGHDSNGPRRARNEALVDVVHRVREMFESTTAVQVK